MRVPTGHELDKGKGCSLRCQVALVKLAIRRCGTTVTRFRVNDAHVTRVRATAIPLPHGPDVSQVMDGSSGLGCPATASGPGNAHHQRRLKLFIGVGLRVRPQFARSDWPGRLCWSLGLEAERSAIYRGL